MLSPLPRCSRRAQVSLRLAHPYQPSPYGLTGRPAHRHFRGLLSVHSRYGLYARTITYVTVIRGLQTFRHLHACPGCFRLEHRRVGLSPTRKCRLCTAHTLCRHSAANVAFLAAAGQVFHAARPRLAVRRMSGLEPGRWVSLRSRELGARPQSAIQPNCFDGSIRQPPPFNSMAYATALPLLEGAGSSQK